MKIALVGKVWTLGGCEKQAAGDMGCKYGCRGICIPIVRYCVLAISQGGMAGSQQEICGRSYKGKAAGDWVANLLKYET